jgi:formylglycine-generating enzyme required for sulfatase activity
MSSGDKLFDDLKKSIEARNVTVVAGSGVACATTKAAPGWSQLIQTGIDHCASALNAKPSWCRKASLLLPDPDDDDDEPSLDLMLSAAELVHQKIKSVGDGEFAGWMREQFESLEPDDSSVIDAIVALETRLVTTNYDDLIEQVSGLRGITWKDRRETMRDVRRDDRRVLHLHGHWNAPESVVLGLESYIEVANDAHAQTVMRTLGAATSLLFVGCGEDGLADPNWGRFLEWLRQFDKDGGHEHRHYRLVLEKDRFDPIGRLFPLVYGKKHSDLAGFLRKLAPADGGGCSASRITSSGKAKLTDCVAAYLERLERHTEFMELIGLGRSLQVELPIAEAYVPLRTTLHRSFEAKESDRFLEGRDEVEVEVEIAEVFRRGQDNKQRGVVLLGEPGSGKTTGAKQLAWQLASGQSLPQDLGLPAGITPVLLRFRELSQEILDAQKSGLKKFLFDRTFCEDASNGVDNPGPELWDLDGGLLWILDGLDEVMDPQARRKVSGWVQKALKNRPKDWFLVTCRFQGYFRKGVPLGPKFAEFHVRPLDDQQIQNFVTEWFSAAYKMLIEPEEKSQQKADEVSGRLLKILSTERLQTRRMRELTTNPLMLTILCVVFHEERKLPTERAELYSRCVRVLLEHWRRDIFENENGQDVQSYDADAAQAVLARMAWWMHSEQDRAAAPLDELAAEAERGLASVSASSGLGRDGAAFIDRMRSEAGLLAKTADGRCGFLHLSFQEYLAATHAAAHGFSKELASQATVSWWQETALLSLRTSETHCRDFFTELLAAGVAENDPNLAQQCIDEARFLPPEPFVEVLEDGKSTVKRQTAVLRLLRSRLSELPTVASVAESLTTSKRKTVASVAKEVIAPVRARSVGSEVAGVVSSRDDRGRKAGDVWVDDRTGITYVWIPAGKFQMGEGDGQHEVQLTQSFWMARYPVTNAQYGLFLTKLGRKAKKPEYWDDRRFNGDDQPVVGVSWDNATAFAEWAGSGGTRVALPTEAQWEYACRAGSTEDYSFGNDVKKLGDYAWYNDNSNNQSQPVGAKRPNDWGLHDMHGNVWEWCQDWHAGYDEDLAVDPTGPKKGSDRVDRGGSWWNSARFCRSAIRGRSTPSYRNFNLGFRVATVPRTGPASK